MSVLIFLVVIFVLVLVHEFGHFSVAKKTGMRVDEFGIGFPPKLFSWKKGETEYTLNLFPIGGFVRIFGENAVDAAESESGVKPADYDRSFVAKSPWQQTAVLIAGVTANIILAWLLFIVALMAGVPTVVEESAASADAQLVIADVLPDGPAATAGIERGAVVTGVTDGTVSADTLTISSFKEFTESRPDAELTVTYTKAGAEKSVTLSPETGIVTDDPDRAAIGVALAMIDTVREPLPTAIWEGTKNTYSTFTSVVVGITSLIVDSVRGQADLSSVAGPVGIVGLVDEAAQFGFASLLMFAALISVNLAVINLLPFPALDGGRLLFVVIEVIKGSPLNPNWVARLNAIGFILLITLMVVVTWSDISKLL